jgi:hypothetical protein
MEKKTVETNIITNIFVLSLLFKLTALVFVLMWLVFMFRVSLLLL